MSSCAAPYFKRVSLELGGKSPLILFADCDLDPVVRQGMNKTWHDGDEWRRCQRLDDKLQRYGVRAQRL
ncbi:hypothetical protein HPB52_006860 [Rhipicephalus sanguineus]|uniref:Aldehyde dehydrogenase domain-containing protein n=1 Tax=Rhipicephalus sanguineus TaxID=34632 RepID=A0A9D4QCQ6_RHISA|nr:hypothetical protein HPB52_006860 [Rhipicephalus sanguineus]